MPEAIKNTQGRVEKSMSNNELNTLKISEIEVTYSPKVTPSERILISSSSDTEKVFHNIWKQSLEHKECFYVLLLNRSNKVLGYLLVSIGEVSGTVVDPKIVFQTALKANASSVILAHNHPSGNEKPSDGDIQLTRKLKEA